MIDGLSTERVEHAMDEVAARKPRFSVADVREELGLPCDGNVVAAIARHILAIYDARGVTDDGEDDFGRSLLKAFAEYQPPASPDADPASSAAQPAASTPEPGPWTRSDLDEWRCPKCGRMTYTPKSDHALMTQCPECPGLVWMEQLFGVAA